MTGLTAKESHGPGPTLPRSKPCSLKKKKQEQTDRHKGKPGGRQTLRCLPIAPGLCPVFPGTPGLA